MSWENRKKKVNSQRISCYFRLLQMIYSDFAGGLVTLLGWLGSAKPHVRLKGVAFNFLRLMRPSFAHPAELLMWRQRSESWFMKPILQSYTYYASPGICWPGSHSNNSFYGYKLTVCREQPVFYVHKSKVKYNHIL